MAQSFERFVYLSPLAAQIARAMARPRAVAALAVVALTTLGWSFLALNTRDQFWLGALCRPLSWANEASGVFVIFAMWAAMTLAMMLPSAAPMILTYSEIAETAARQKQNAISPLVLTSGYVAVWLGFSALLAAASAIQPDLGTSPASSLMSAATFAFAGLYQFSALKHACLSKCRAPFQFFFVNWKTTARGVFGLGLRQGVYCLGCCWAMMLLMIVTGAMNIVWMAALAAAMTIEKMAAGPLVSRLLGAALLGASAGFALAASGAIATVTTGAGVL